MNFSEIISNIPVQNKNDITGIIYDADEIIKSRRIFFYSNKEFEKYPSALSELYYTYRNESGIIIDNLKGIEKLPNLRRVQLLNLNVDNYQYFSRLKLIKDGVIENVCNYPITLEQNYIENLHFIHTKGELFFKHLKLDKITYLSLSISNTYFDFNNFNLLPDRYLRININLNGKLETLGLIYNLQSVLNFFKTHEKASLSVFADDDNSVIYGLKYHGLKKIFKKCDDLFKKGFLKSKVNNYVNN